MTSFLTEITRKVFFLFDLNKICYKIIANNPKIPLNITKIANKLASILSNIIYKNVIVPGANLRSGGPEFQNDIFFLKSAQREADRLVKYFEFKKASTILDVGCGAGRLPIGILTRIGEIQKYTGIDVNKKAITWCNYYITRAHPNFKFIHIDMANPRYNPKGKITNVHFKLPFNDKEFNIIYLYSVFSHMPEKDVRAYLKEFKRIIKPLGKIFLTAFIEEGVPNITINPPGYRMKWRGKLHCVRYSKRFFNSLLAENGFKINYFEYEKETDGQSALYISQRRRGHIINYIGY